MNAKAGRKMVSKMEENKNTSNPDTEENMAEENMASEQTDVVAEETATEETTEEITLEEPAEETSEETVIEEPAEEIAAAEIAVDKKPIKRILQGRVISDKPDKTIVVNVVRKVAHPLYKKYYKQSKKFMAHDENNECNTGDSVRIKECRPMSAKKRWVLLDILERAK